MVKKIVFRHNTRSDGLYNWVNSRCASLIDDYPDITSVEVVVDKLAKRKGDQQYQCHICCTIPGKRCLNIYQKGVETGRAIEIAFDRMENNLERKMAIRMDRRHYQRALAALDSDSLSARRI